MAITRNILHIMGGTISVESEPGKGSCFTVTLPLKLLNRAKEKKVNDLNILKRENFGGKRVLLAEDNEINREIMRGWNGFSGKERGTLHLSIAERWTADLCGYPPELF